jgi:hypothetical protein
MSNKLRLAIVLPCIQVLLAFALLRAASHQRLPRGWDTPHTSDAALVCVGISAPAFPLITLAMLLPKQWQVGTVLSFDAAQICFLLGVVVVWYWTGRALDRRMSRETWNEANVGVGSIMLRLLKCSWGIAVIVVGVRTIQIGVGIHSGGPILGYVVSASLFFAWAVVLIVGSLWPLATWLTRSSQREATRNAP